MVKKISALILALVICLSVVVMPMSVNAAKVELNGQDIAFALEWDKPYYNPGDTAYLSVYMDARDDLSLFTGAFVIGLDSDVFSQADNSADAIKAGSTTADWFAAYYLPASEQITHLATTVAPKVTAANTPEEQAIYDWYVKYTVAKDSTGGSHENTASKNAGFGGADFNPNEPICVLPLVVSADAEPGAVAKAAITSGSKTCTPVQTTWKYYKNPGSATTTANIAATATSVEKAVTADEVLVTNEIVNPLKGQIRFHKNADGTFANAFDVRALAVISEKDFAEKFGSEENAAKMIKEIGFIFAAGSNVKEPDLEAAKTLAESDATEANGYFKQTVGYLSSSISDKNYAFSCIVEDITTAEIANELVAVGYIKYEKADGQVDYDYYAAAQSVSYEALYNAYVDLAFPA